MSISRLAHFLEPFCTLLARLLCHIFYQISCFRFNIIFNIAPIFKGKKIVLWSLLVRLRDFTYFEVVYFFLDGEDKQNFDSPVSLHNYFELK